MRIMDPAQYIWLMIGMATCHKCKHVSLDHADYVTSVVHRTTTELPVCEKCEYKLICEDCTTIHDDEKKIYTTAACADQSYGYCCHKLQCIDGCDWKCVECGEQDENKLVAIEFHMTRHIQKTIVCKTCRETEYFGCEEIPKILWWGLSEEEYARRYYDD